MKRLFSKVADGSRAFMREEDGAALTEYLVLLGILIAGVIGAVGIFAGNLADAWTNWGTWISDNIGPEAQQADPG